MGFYTHDGCAYQYAMTLPADKGTVLVAGRSELGEPMMFNADFQMNSGAIKRTVDDPNWFVLVVADLASRLRAVAEEDGYTV